ncbi:hypothetical protein PQU92_09795 [Asticcacaulis sp. BYS171W]|uniref:Uncharacterized protein n=1 Tax=Asticcacaulis aquaticus TaxID=2984212 RepID=A0ABT5HU50_9CAUL|nr:hypothetical protein [Asticcacaulis aquaticus]MDC7683569.1 hypothetical protein [Asticcacaulis aquaticus]
MKKCRTLLALLLMTALSHPATAQDVSLDTMVKRQFVTAANTRCQWFDGPTALALKAGMLQTRNSALNHGVAPDIVYGALSKAKTAAARADCRNPALLAEVETMKGAYKGFVTHNRLTLPGLRAQWQADRTQMRDEKWRLVQYQQTGDVALAIGLYGTLTRQTLSVMVQFPDGRQPYAARLIVRDPYYRSNGLINREAYAVSARMPAGFSTYDLSVPAMQRRQTSIALTDAPRVNLAGFTVEGKYAGHQAKRDTVRFDFPMRTTTAIARLDPREDIVVAFDFDTGTQYARFEAGDFVPGLVFVTLPSPYGN